MIRRSPGWLRRIEALLGIEVREGEWRLVLLFFANLFLLLTAYYMLKVIREPLVLLEGGAVQRSYARGLQAALSLLIIPGYGFLSDRYEPAKLVKWIMGVFVACVAGFISLGRIGFHVGFAFYVWLGLFSTLSIAQFWSLASDVLTEAEGVRLFPLVAAGGTFGGICGAQLATHLSYGHPYQPMLVAAALLVSCALLTHITHDAALAHRARVPGVPTREHDRRGGLSLVLHDRYLLLIALCVLLLNFVNTTGDFVLAQLISARAEDMPAFARHYFITEFYGNFQTYVSLFTSLVQIVVVARLLKLMGIGSALLCLPLLVLGGYGVASFFPLLTLVAFVKVGQDSAEYSLQNTSQQALFLRASRAAKYKGKAAIDTLFVRLGDLAATLWIFIGAQLSVSIRAYAIANVVAALMWLALVFQLRKHTRVADAAPVASTEAVQAATASVRSAS